jgi:hypothetical protein
MTWPRTNCCADQALLVQRCLRRWAASIAHYAQFPFESLGNYSTICGTISA